MFELLLSRSFLGILFTVIIGCSFLVIYGANTSPAMKISYKVIISGIFGLIIIFSVVALLFIMLFGVNT